MLGAKQTESHSSLPWNFFSTSPPHVSAWKAKKSKQEEEGCAFLTSTWHTFSPGQAENDGDERRRRAPGTGKTPATNLLLWEQKDKWS